MIRDRVAGADGRSLRAVKRGQGKILDLGGRRVAAYRDESGATTIRSATCTHMGCIVDWNEAERTWDCPCHGIAVQAKRRRHRRPCRVAAFQGGIGQEWSRAGL